MNISCEPVKMSCIKPPTPSDISHLKAADIAPNSLINKIFSGLASDYKEMKKSSPSKSKSKSKTKTKGGKKSRRRQHKTLKRKHMRGGALSEFQKNRVADIVILLVAGTLLASGSYWSLSSALENYIVSIGLLPKLCGQSWLEHTASNIASLYGSENCVARAQRYNTMVTGLVAAITTAGWFTRDMFTKTSITNNYTKIHTLVKQTVFGSERSPSYSTPPRKRSGSPLSRTNSRRNRSSSPSPGNSN
jgi:hypothetical protein